LSYRSSARDFLRDRAQGREWRSRLPTHRTVVAALDSMDDIGGGRGRTRYEYHDGMFDQGLRQFIGFGMVDVYDADPPDNQDPDTPPPLLVRTWALSSDPQDLALRAKDFYAGDATAVHLPPVTIEDSDGLTTEEQVWAMRAVAGSPWREEVYRLKADGAAEPDPVRTSEYAQGVRRLQPTFEEDDGVFAGYGAQSIHYDYHGAPADPRVTHQVLLAASDYGAPLRAAVVAYPRRPTASALPEQLTTSVSLVTAKVVDFDSQDRYETGVELESAQYALFGLDPGPGGVFARDDLGSQVDQALAAPVAFFADPPAGAPCARLLQLARKRYCDPEQAVALAAGSVGDVTLLRHVEQAILPDDAVDAAFDGKVTAAMLSGEGGYTNDDGFWWAPGPASQYADTDAFYRIAVETTPSGGSRTVTFDADHLLPVSAVDDFQNTVTADNDYQAMAPWRVTDHNGNVTEVVYDPWGVIVSSSLHGRQLGADGQPHKVGAAEAAAYVSKVASTIADVLADPAAYLQGGDRYVFNDIGAWARDQSPPASVMVESDARLYDGEQDAAAAARPVRVNIGYFDGFGRPLQRKRLVEPGPAISRDGAGQLQLDASGVPKLADAAQRWLASGFVIYNRKGWATRIYEPFFTAAPAYEADAALRANGVATHHQYDAEGREVRRDFPNGAFATSIYSPWRLQQADAIDNVVGSAYEAARATLPATDPERMALEQARPHADTPTLIELDPLGRPVRVRETGDGGEERVTWTALNDAGAAAAVTGPRGIQAFQYRYDMLGRVIFENGADAGKRWVFQDAAGGLRRTWDERGIETSYAYDAGGRPTGRTVTDAGGARQIESLTYGDNPLLADAAARNARGRPVTRLDEAGQVQVLRYDLTGSALETVRQFRTAYDKPTDWATPAVSALDGAKSGRSCRWTPPAVRSRSWGPTASRATMSSARRANSPMCGSAPTTAPSRAS
jgi:YD repeat-containing protein